MASQRTVFVVDTDDSIGEALASLLGTYGIRVLAYQNASNFLDALTQNDSDAGCLLVEANLPGSSGLSLLRELRKRGFKLPVILLANTSSAEVRHEAILAGAVDLIEKPLVNAFLLERLSQVLPDAVDSVPVTSMDKSLASGERITFRVIQPEDASIEQAFVRGLSTSSKHFRFFMNVKSLSPAMLREFTHPNYPDSYAIIATVKDNEQERQIGVARYAPTQVAGSAEFAVVVADEWQGHGIATHLLSGIIVAAAVAGIKRLEGYVLRENSGMLTLARELGFVVSADPDDSTIVRAVKHLGEDAHDRTLVSMSDTVKNKHEGKEP